MSIAEPDEAAWTAAPGRLVDELGDPNWRVRQTAVDRLGSDSSSQLIPRVVEIVRTAHRDLGRLNAAIQVLRRTPADVVPALLPLLSDSDADARGYAALTLGERGDTRAIPALIAALSDVDTNVRVHAIEALGKLQAAAAVDPLMGFVESQQFELAFPALDALLAIGDGRVAHRLLTLLDNPLLKSTIVEVLGGLGDEDAIAPLLDQLSDAGVSPGAIAEAIVRIHDRYQARFGTGQAISGLVHQVASPGNASIFRSAILVATGQQACSLVCLIGWLPGQQAEEALVGMLDRADLRPAVVSALAMRGESVMAALLERFACSSREGQLALIELYGKLADRRAVGILLASVESDDEELVAKSWDALARIGDDRIYFPAQRFLGNANPRVRQAAVGAINSLGHPSTGSDVQRWLCDPSPLVCESALRIAAYIGFPDCIDAILACCDHPDERVRRTAIEHLPCIDDDRAVVRLEQALSDDLAAIRAAAVGALGESESSRAIPLLCQALDDRDVWVRYFAVRSLAQKDYSGEVTNKLVSLVAYDPAMQVRVAAVDALRHDALDTLMTLSAVADDDLAIAALGALGATKHPDAFAPLLLAMRSDSPQRQTAAIRALGKAELPAAVVPLQQAAMTQAGRHVGQIIEVLGQIPAAASADALLEVLERPTHRRATIAALTRLGDIAVSRLACRLHQLSIDVRRAVVEVLGNIRSVEAIDLLETALADSEPAVRHSALATLSHVHPVRRQQPNAIGNQGER